MMSVRFHAAWLVVTLLIAPGQRVHAQKPSAPAPGGDPAEVRSALMDANNVTVLIYNTGEFCRPGVLPNTANLVWEGLGYAYEFVPLLAAEVTGQSAQTLHIVDDGLVHPQHGDYSTDGLVKWGWLPRAGYARPGATVIATSTDPLTWPQAWTSWPGEEGAGVLAGLREAYYVVDDFTNAEFDYFPFPSEPGKRGLGVRLEVRVYQFGGSLRDGVVVKYKLVNESPKDLTRCCLGFYADPSVGGSADYADDLVNFIHSAAALTDTTLKGAIGTIYNWDADTLGMDGLRPGYLSFQLLETPQNRGLTSFWATQWAAVFPSNDEIIWQVLSSDTIDRNQTLFTTPSDNVSVFGTGAFSLAAGDSVVFSAAVFFSKDFDDMAHDANYIHYVARWPRLTARPGDSGGDPAYAVQITSPDAGAIAGNVPVSWSLQGSDPAARLFLECSSDGGTTWQALGWELPDTPPFTWNTTILPDGVHYLLRIVAHSPDLGRYAFDVASEYLTVNNPGNARPEVSLHLESENGVVGRSPAAVTWEVRDADNGVLSVEVGYGRSPSGPFTSLHSGTYQGGEHLYQWDCATLPNAPGYYLRLEASDGSRDSSVVVGPFEIRLEAGVYPPSAIEHVAGVATPKLLLQVVDPAVLTGHQYEMSFMEGPASPAADLLLSVRDVTHDVPVIVGHTVGSEGSTPLFDGLKLTVQDTPVGIDSAQSGWEGSVLTNMFAAVGRPVSLSHLPFDPAPIDLEFRWNRTDTSASGKWLYPGDTLLNNSARKVVLCPFRIVNVTDTSHIRAFVNAALTDSIWRPGREIVVLTPPNYSLGGRMARMLGMLFSEPASGGVVLPTEGDSYVARSTKPLTTSDLFRFTADNGYVATVAGRDVPSSHALYQNFPNPFNPSTTVRFHIASAGLVILKVYDVLGREVGTLAQGRMAAGGYDVLFDARKLASGVYFCRLEVHPENARGGTAYLETRKMVLTR